MLSPAHRPSLSRSSSLTIYKAQHQLQQPEHPTLHGRRGAARGPERVCLLAAWRARNCSLALSSCCRSQVGLLARWLVQVSSSLVARSLLLKPNLQQDIAAGRYSFTVTSAHLSICCLSSIVFFCHWLTGVTSVSHVSKTLYICITFCNVHIAYCTLHIAYCTCTIFCSYQWLAKWSCVQSITYMYCVHTCITLRVSKNRINQTVTY